MLFLFANEYLLGLSQWQNACTKDAMAQDSQEQNAILVVQCGVKMAIAREHLIKNNQVGQMEQSVKAARKEKLVI